MRRPVAIAAAALVLAVLILAGSALQLTLTVGEAVAQSSVRPPDNAVNLGSSPESVLPGGSVRPPAPPSVPVPMQPGVARSGGLVPAPAAAEGQGPLGAQGANSVSDFWAAMRRGDHATVSIPDQKAAVLVQDDGMRWLRWRAKGGPLQKWGGYALAGTVGLLALFFLLRGRIRIEHGKSGVMIERFKGYERFAHWLLAVSFILLALSGLNLLYGRDYVLPVIGKANFAAVTWAGKWLHNNMAWGFMLGLAMVFVLWVAHNIPGLIDLKWLARGGGLFTKGSHPPARKFNAGQKLVFWAVILTGVSISLSGISLLFPYQAPLFAKTFAVLNDWGVSDVVMGGPLPARLSAVQEMHYAEIWHSIIAFAMAVVVLAHIYIGTIGMEGAFSAMGSGRVDLNWAEEHHSLWVAEQEARQPGAGHGATTPAE